MQWDLTVGLRYTHDNKSNPSYYAGAFVKPLDWDPSIYVGESAIRELAAGLPNCVPKTDPGYIPFVHCADTNTSRTNLRTMKSAASSACSTTRATT